MPDPKLVIALYLRLSKEDEGKKDESNSIRNQRRMLTLYAKKIWHDCEIIEFADDGFSGTNMERPALQKMLALAREGKICCVIVKDFSRFSRDYIELGTYLDQIFPFLQVRFISVNDHYDSESQLGTASDIGTAFRGLLYDLYSKDLSVKVKSALANRRQQGQYVSAHCPFGYCKDPGDRHKLLVCEEEAEIVQRIYGLALEGHSCREIAGFLNHEGVKPPIVFRIERGEVKRKAAGKIFQWEAAKVSEILRNRSYIGDMVYGKYGRDVVGGKNHIKPRSEWKYYENHHPAIIDRDVFENLNRMRAAKKCGISRKYGGSEKNDENIC